MDRYTVYDVLDLRSGDRMLIQARQFKKLRPGGGAGGGAVFEGAVDDGSVPFVGLRWLRRVDNSAMVKEERRRRADEAQAAMIADRHAPRRYGFKVGADGKLESTSLAETAIRMAREAKRKSEALAKLQAAAAAVEGDGEAEARAARAREERRKKLNLRPGTMLLTFRGSLVIANCLQFETDTGEAIQAKLVLGESDEVTKQLALMLFKRRNRKYVGKPFQALVTSLPYRNTVSEQAVKLAEGTHHPSRAQPALATGGSL